MTSLPWQLDCCSRKVWRTRLACRASPKTTLSRTVGAYRASEFLSLIVTRWKDLSINVLTLIFRAYLHDQSMEHLSATLKRGGIRDLLAFFAPNKRGEKVLEEYFRKANLAQVAEWWAKKQYAVVKDGLIKELKGFCEREESPETVCGNQLRPQQM